MFLVMLFFYFFSNINNFKMVNLEKDTARISSYSSYILITHHRQEIIQTGVSL
jgi:hypothetical protein